MNGSESVAVAEVFGEAVGVRSGFNRDAYVDAIEFVAVHAATGVYVRHSICLVGKRDADLYSEDGVKVHFGTLDSTLGCMAGRLAARGCEVTLSSSPGKGWTYDGPMTLRLFCKGTGEEVKVVTRGMITTVSHTRVLET